jgi:hypothetical protein
MAAQVDLAGVIQHLQGDNEEQKNAAMVQLAQFGQNLDQAAAPAPQLITLRQASEQGQAGDADLLKITDLMPASWGSTKDGESESHCIIIGNYVNMQGYYDNPSKIAWF